MVNLTSKSGQYDLKVVYNLNLTLKWSKVTLVTFKMVDLTLKVVKFFKNFNIHFYVVLLSLSYFHSRTYENVCKLGQSSLGEVRDELLLSDPIQVFDSLCCK